MDCIVIYIISNLINNYLLSFFIKKLMLGTKNQFQTNLYFATVALLSKNSIPFWVDTKSLLSLMGIKLGLPLLDDENISISIYGEHFSKLKKVVTALGMNYRSIMIRDFSGRNWIENEFCRLAVLSRWKRRHKAFKINITPKYKVDSHYRWVDNRSCKHPVRCNSMFWFVVSRCGHVARTDND